MPVSQDQTFTTANGQRMVYLIVKVMRGQATAPREAAFTPDQRTCSAREQVISGLRGAGIDVVLVGDISSGRPVGFLPTARCGTTYSVVNFESVNALEQGRYLDVLRRHAAWSRNSSSPWAARQNTARGPAARRNGTLPAFIAAQGPRPAPLAC